MDYYPEVVRLCQTERIYNAEHSIGTRLFYLLRTFTPNSRRITKNSEDTITKNSLQVSTNLLSLSNLCGYRKEFCCREQCKMPTEQHLAPDKAGMSENKRSKAQKNYWFRIVSKKYTLNGWNSTRCPHAGMTRDISRMRSRKISEKTLRTWIWQKHANDEDERSEKITLRYGYWWVHTFAWHNYHKFMKSLWLKPKMISRSWWRSKHDEKLAWHGW